MKLYAWFWYYTEFWLKPVDRRPYTFIIRDFYYCHPILTLFFSAWVSYLFNLFVFVDWKVWTGLSVGTLLGHLFWGKEYVKGEQENPPYTGGK